MDENGMPRNNDELAVRINLNQQVTGFGFDTTMHMPCPFCGAPDFMVFKVIDTLEASKQGGTCKECKRSMKTIVTSIRGGRNMEFVQSAGPDQPDWLSPKMRRVDA